MPKFILEGASEPDFTKLDSFTQGYIHAAFFTEANEDNEELAGLGFTDLAPQALEEIIKDCRAFQLDNKVLLEKAYELDYSENDAGHDFWFTRNGHGVGFWDREELETDNIGNELADSCGYGTKYDVREMYLGDDEKVYMQ